MNDRLKKSHGEEIRSRDIEDAKYKIKCLQCRDSGAKLDNT